MGRPIAEDFAQADESVRTLQGIGAQWYYPGHGAAIAKRRIVRLKV